jgi:hypothetical protein
MTPPYAFDGESLRIYRQESNLKMVEFGQVFADNGRILPIECREGGGGDGVKRIEPLIASKCEAIG